jgi:hypothetical protein
MARCRSNQDVGIDRGDKERKVFDEAHQVCSVARPSSVIRVVLNIYMLCDRVPCLFFFLPLRQCTVYLTARQNLSLMKFNNYNPS